MFLCHKDDTLKFFELFSNKVQRDKVYYISFIRSDHGGEFENNLLESSVIRKARFSLHLDRLKKWIRGTKE